MYIALNNVINAVADTVAQHIHEQRDKLLLSRKRDNTVNSSERVRSLSASFTVSITLCWAATLKTSGVRHAEVITGLALRCQSGICERSLFKSADSL